MEQLFLLQTDATGHQLALLEDGILVEYDIHTGDEKPLAGDVYCGIVEKVLPGMQAAFVNIATEKNAYLPLEEIEIPPGTSPRIQDIIKVGQPVVVQVRKEAVGEKGPKVSCRLQLVGHSLILLGSEETIAVSHKIETVSDRMRLEVLARALRKDDHKGLIVRTVALQESEAQIRSEYEYLHRCWEKLLKQIAETHKPGRITEARGILQLLRDALRPTELDKIVVNNATLCNQLQAEFPYLAQKGKIRFLEGNVLEQYQLQKALAECAYRKIWLKNGGYLVLDHTEALTVFDVNTGKYIGKADASGTMLQMNCEAAKEIGRQIRLRNLSGIILIDFISMDNDENREIVRNTLEEALQRDRIKTNLCGWTQTGLFEMTRQKIRAPLLLGDAKGECR